MGGGGLVDLIEWGEGEGVHWVGFDGEGGRRDLGKWKGWGLGGAA